MSKFNAVVIHLALLCAMVVGGWYDIEAAGNIAKFIIWILIIITFIATMIPSKELFKDGKNKSNYIVRIIFFIEVLNLAALGMFFTAFFYTASWFVIWIKRNLNAEHSA